MSSKSQHGFTLIELMVAVAIFAVLTLLGWQVFNNLIQVRERTSVKAEQLGAVQETYEQLSRDFSQALARPVMIGSTAEAAFYLSNNEFHLTRTGVIDPLQLGVAPMERVQYLLQQGKLIRQSFAQVDQSGNLVPNKTVLLSNVGDWQVTTLDKSTSTTWPVDNTPTTTPTTGQIPTGNSTLPMAVQISLTVNDQPLRWLFPMITNLPQPLTVGGTSGTNTGSSSAVVSAASTVTSTPTQDGH